MNIPAFIALADQRLGQRLIGSPAAVQQDMDCHLDLFLEAVVKVVMHLLNEVVVVQAVEIEFAGVARHECHLLLRKSAVRSGSPWSGAGAECRERPQLARRVAGFRLSQPRHRDMF